MKVDFLLSFKNHNDVLDLDKDLLNLISENFTKSFTKKAKKKNIKPILKCNLLKNLKLQNEKNTIECKSNLLINKLSKNNFEEIVIEFISKFTELEQEDFNSILETIFIKMIKDEKFIGIFYKFYNQIYNIYNSLFDLTNEHFINLIEMKIKYHYDSYNLNNKYSFIERFNSEENRINNLKLMIFLLDNGNFNKEMIKIVSDLILKSNYIPDIYFWFSNKFIMNNINLEDYHQRLTNKLNVDINNRYIILLKNLLDNNNIEYNDLDTDDESECDVKIDNLDKSEFEIEITNILEEYLLLEEFEEVISFVDSFNKDENMIRIFMKSLLDFYFNSNMTNSSKFKNLFINLKKSKLLKSEIFKITLNDILNNEDKYDYVNLPSKVDNIINIYKIIQVKINKDYINNIRNLSQETQNN